MNQEFIEYEGHKYWYEHKLAENRVDICLATKDPKKYCNGFYKYSDKDPGSGKAKAIKTKERNVHAFVRGLYAMNGMGTTAKRNDLPIKILYNPFSNLGFHHNYCSNNTEIRGTRFCIINEEGVKAAYTF